MLMSSSRVCRTQRISLLSWLGQLMNGSINILTDASLGWSMLYQYRHFSFACIIEPTKNSWCSRAMITKNFGYLVLVCYKTLSCRSNELRWPRSIGVQWYALFLSLDQVEEERLDYFGGEGLQAAQRYQLQSYECCVLEVWPQAKRCLINFVLPPSSIFRSGMLRHNYNLCKDNQWKLKQWPVEIGAMTSREWIFILSLL